MEMEEKFTDILEKGERIIKIYKPDKRKFWTSLILSVVFISAISGWIWAYCALFGAIPEAGKSFDPGLFWLLFGIANAVFFGGIALTLLFTVIFGRLYYNNRYYAYTSKRIIIRGGIIGIDYKSLEFKHLTATVVNVSFIDKILRRNTGSLSFGSPASPISGFGMNSRGMGNPYQFKHILKPYDTLREIKELIDTCDKSTLK
jgi:hypothetical protein